MVDQHGIGDDALFIAGVLSKRVRRKILIFALILFLIGLGFFISVPYIKDDRIGMYGGFMFWFFTSLVLFYWVQVKIGSLLGKDVKKDMGDWTR